MSGRLDGQGVRWPNRKIGEAVKGRTRPRL